jgi:hypothetical protein
VPAVINEPFTMRVSLRELTESEHRIRSLRSSTNGLTRLASPPGVRAKSLSSAAFALTSGAASRRGLQAGRTAVSLPSGVGASRGVRHEGRSVAARACDTAVTEAGADGRKVKRFHIRACALTDQRAAGDCACLPIEQIADRSQTARNGLVGSVWPFQPDAVVSFRNARVASPGEGRLPVRGEGQTLATNQSRAVVTQLAPGRRHLRRRESDP